MKKSLRFRANYFQSLAYFHLFSRFYVFISLPKLHTYDVYVFLFFSNMKAHLLYRSGEREFIARRNNDSMKKRKKEENMRKFRWVPFLIKKLEYGEDMLEKFVSL